MPADNYSWEVLAGKHNGIKAWSLTKPSLKFDNNILDNECFTHVYLMLYLGAPQKRPLGDSKWPFVTTDT